MTTATIVNIILCILSFALAATSVVIVVLTLRQNSKMLEASTRPYVSVFVVRGFLTQIVLKNFGVSGAVITSLTCDANFTNCVIKDYEPFKNVVGLHLAPNEYITYEVKGSQFFQSNCARDILISVSYRSDSGGAYSDRISISLKSIDASLSSQTHITDQNWKEHLVGNLQDISETLLKK